MPSFRVLAVAVSLLLGAGCAALPRQPLLPFVIELTPILPPGLEPQVLLLTSASRSPTATRCESATARQ